MFFRQPSSERATRAIDRTSEHAAVGASEIHILEYAAAERLRFERPHRLESTAVHRHDLAWFDVALDGGADDVERARLRREDERVAESTHGERTPAARIARGEQRVAD